ncbi:cysteine hydrolase family protein [Novosphingobium album (ex Hu et al. 2023)]|uniref:Cysteine hydrolase n=1 Tax=Novosphingobium album (ex Hu et al. 2023) TaxID=2930093 RepID=A0ABT0B805_9SPHN|nr:isochorismatase family cysteine hydrolase [Novosphingobium album (ex Hu et al. 2023)]MCJ2180959.1 cysteine hydrolase [Novosphingobium album (ex Hu et al. 2023)]
MTGIALPETAHWPQLGTAGRNVYHVSDAMVDMRRPQIPVKSARLEALPQSVVFDLSRSAFIVIDMQNDFCCPSGWMGSMGVDVSGAAALAAPINAVTAAFRAAGVPVIWLNWGVRPDRLNLSPGTQHPFNPTGAGAGLAGTVTTAPAGHKLLMDGSWGAQIIDDLVQAPGDIHIGKHRISGFWDTPLDSILRNLKVDTLFFAGVNADHCVLGTLMDANFHGYDTVLVEDCTATSSPDFCYQATLHNVRFCFGFTATSALLVEAVDAAPA